MKRFLLVIGVAIAVPSPAYGDARPSRPLALLRLPYMGVACPYAPNSIACDRVGLAVWLRRPAVRLTATIAGRRVAMRVPADANCGPGKYNGLCGTYFEGFLRPAGLLNGPLKVRPDQGRYIWIGRHPVFAPVRIVAYFPDGRAASVTLRVQLHPGWG